MKPPRLTLVLRSLALAWVLPYAAAAANDAPAPARVAVDLAPGADASAWFAAALEGMVGRELSRFHRVALAEKLDPSTCRDRRASCLVDRYGAAGVDLVVLGTVDAERFEYEVYAEWTHGIAFRGSLGLARGLTSAVLQQRLSAVVRPIVQAGGWADRVPGPPAAEASAAAPPSAEDEARTAELRSERADGWRITWGVFALWMALPLLLGVLLLGPGTLRVGKSPASWDASATVVVASGVLLLSSVAWHPDLSQWVPRPPFSLLLAVIAGGLWGAFALLTGAWLFPRLYGIGRIRHDALWPLLRSWLGLVLLRGAMLSAYVPVFAGALLACRRLGLDPRVTYGLVLPGAGLLGHFWFLTLVDGLVVYLDRALIVGPASEQNPWHRTLKRYFLGYVRRQGIDVDAALLERILFLPGKLGVTCYGGGLSRPRVVVDVAARDLALGELPDETEAPERTVNPEQLPWGLLLPVERARRDTSRARVAAARRRPLAPARRAPAPKLVGQNATLLGWVLPAAVGTSVPLISDSQEDFDVVRGLLTEHYAAFEKNLDEDEYDDTDPSQKDFLFGALLQQVGAIQRQDVRLSTFACALELASANASWLSRRVLRGVLALHARFLSAPAATIADSFVALRGGLDALIQYFHVKQGGDPALLTARADAPKLLRTSQAILAGGERTPPADAAVRRRTETMAQLFYSPIAPRSRYRVRALLGVIALCVGGYALAQATRAAASYHPIYLERMHGGAADGGQPL